MEKFDSEQVMQRNSRLQGVITPKYDDTKDSRSQTSKPVQSGQRNNIRKNSEVYYNKKCNGGWR